MVTFLRPIWNPLDGTTCEAGAGPVEVVVQRSVEVVVLVVHGGHPRGELARLVVAADCNRGQILIGCSYFYQGIKLR